MSIYVVIYLLQHGRKTQLLHVFQEDFILNNLEKKRLGVDNILLDSGKKNFDMMISICSLYYIVSKNELIHLKLYFRLVFLS
jgi:hypothetical protein